MVINEAFSCLILEKGWYKKSGVTRQIASRDKMRFLKGNLADEKIRMYLKAAGWECVQKESWNKK